uniref:Uncharacterized protein n=1 Tax=Physcomitrium patens TaxID=3218 RepID=A0A7I4FI09_PHYPA
MRNWREAKSRASLSLRRWMYRLRNLRRTCAANIAKLEEKAFALQKNLSCVTNTCVQNEHELHCQSRRVEELQKNIHIKQKELMASTTEVQRLQQECEDMVNKTKDNLETQLLRQAQQHTKIVQKLQKQFRAQWEEYTKTGGPCF